MKKLSISLIAFALVGGASSLVIFGCGDSTESTLPTLTAADLNETAPCPNQDLLTSTQFVTDLQAATAFSFFYPTGNGAPGFCGFTDSFSVTNETEVQVTAFAGYDMDAVLDAGNAVCGDDSGQQSLPKAGVYRKDGKFTANGRTYRVRVRVTVTAGTPDVLGETAASQGITDLETDLNYEVNGTVVAEDETLFTNVTGALPSATVVVKKESDDSTVMSVLIELICAEDITT